MSLKFNCPYCGAEIMVKYLRPGEKAKCYQCGKISPVPENHELSNMDPVYFKKSPRPVSEDISFPPVEASVLGPRTIAEIFKEIVEVYKNNFLVIIVISAFFAFPLFFINNQSAIQYSNPLSYEVNPNGSLTGFLILIIFYILGTPIFAGAYTSLITSYYLDRKSAVLGSFGDAFRRYPTLLIVSIISILACTFMAILIIGLPLAIYFSIAWSVIFPVVMLENINGTGAMARSFELVRENWWRVFSIWIISNVFIFLIGLIIGFIPIFGDLVSDILLPPIWIIAMVIIFFDLKVRKGGYNPDNLAEEMDQLRSGKRYKERQSGIAGTNNPI